MFYDAEQIIELFLILLCHINLASGRTARPAAPLFSFWGEQIAREQKHFPMGTSFNAR